MGVITYPCWDQCYSMLVKGDQDILGDSRTKSKVGPSYMKEVTDWTQFRLWLVFASVLFTASMLERGWYIVPVKMIMDMTTNYVFQNFTVNTSKQHRAVVFHKVAVTLFENWGDLSLSLVRPPTTSWPPASSWHLPIQGNLSVTTTSIIKFITCDLFSNVFLWRLKVPIYSC